MPFNAKTFRDQMQYGGARPNKYEIQITPKENSFFNKTSIEKTIYMANATSVPAAVIGTIPLPYFGRMINVAGDRMFEDWNCVIYTDEDMVTRNAFEKWNSMMAYTDYDTNQEHGLVSKKVNSYVSDVIVTQFAKTGEAIKYYKLVNAFPYMVSPVQLAWQANDQVYSFDVQWKFDYFVTSLTPFPTSSAYAIGDVVNSIQINSQN